MPKLNYTEILPLKESCNLINQQHFGPYFENHNFARHGIGGEISLAILNFNLDYFHRKLTAKFFKKKSFWALFAQICELCQEKGTCQFLNIPIIYHCIKKSEETNDSFLRKMPN